MKIVVLAMVKNEEVFVESSVRYWLTFADQIILFDHYSNDGTMQILQELLAEYGDKLILFNKYFAMGVEHRQAQVTNAMMDAAFNQYGADLVIPLDADEYPYLPEGGSVREFFCNLPQDSFYTAYWTPFAPPENDYVDPSVFVPLSFVRRKTLLMTEWGKSIVTREGYYRDKPIISAGNHVLYESSSGNLLPLVDLTPKLFYAHYVCRGKEHYITKNLRGWLAIYSDIDWEPGIAKQYELACEQIVETNGDVSLEVLDWYALSSNGMTGESVDDIQNSIASFDPHAIYPDIQIKYTHKYVKNKKPIIILFESAIHLAKQYRELGREDRVKTQELNSLKNKYEHIDSIVAAKDQHITNLEGFLVAKDQHILDLDGILVAKNQHIVNLEDNLADVKQQHETAMTQLAHYENHYNIAIAQRDDYSRQMAHYQRMYNEITNATFWKITAPFRAVTGWFKKLVRSNRYTRLLFKGLKSLLREGPSVAWMKAKRKIQHRHQLQTQKVHTYTKEELEKQKTVKFPKDITFSILVPLYNTPEKFLREMIQSVLDQTYGKWELCLADGSDAAHKDVAKIVKQYAKKDKRIVYKKLEENKGISGNTNACIEMATGDYIALFDHDDLLHPAALFEMMNAICDKNADFIYTDENTFQNTPADAYCPHFKADFAPDTLRSYNYICHFTAFKKDLLEKIGGGFRSEFDGSQDYDMVLRLTEKAEHIVHIPKILYYWRSHANSVASDISAKPYTITAAKRALQEHLERVGLKGEVLDSSIPSTYRIAYEIEGNPLISILIPTKDHIGDLKKCIDSIRDKSTYQNWEIIVIENNSTEAETFAYYAELEKDSRIHVVTWKGEFNYSAINNFGAKSANGEYMLLLNNDVEIITPDWLEQMLMFAQRDDVGAVGAMLYYPDDTVQHAGVILGIGGVAGHAHKYFPRNDYGYMSRMTIAQNYSCVTAACVMISRNVWEEVQGLDETFKVAFNDVDLCMRIRKAGYLVVWTPYAELYHYESKSRGVEDTIEKQKRFQGEVLRFQSRWTQELKDGDPYYNPNLSLTREDFSLREN